MLVNAWYNDYINIYDKKVPDVSAPDKNTDEYGFVVVFTQNPSNPDSGNSKRIIKYSQCFSIFCRFFNSWYCFKIKITFWNC